MPIQSDCHIHSSFSGDSKAPMDDMIQKALSLGLLEICFTEHQDFDFVYQEENPEEFFEVNTDSYLYDLLMAREQYHGKIYLSFGIELGMQTHLAQKNSDYVKSHEFDFVIASSHLCNRKDPYYPSFFEGRREEDGYHEYFQYISECLKTFTDFDVYGHLDYVLRYGPNTNKNFHFAEYKEDIDSILKKLIENGKGIEVNSSGFAYGLGQPHPCREIIQRYKELGGEIITVGSDAHAPEKMAYAFPQVEQLLKDCGFKYYTVFHRRVPLFVKL